MGDSIKELRLSAKTYVNHICDKIKQLMKWNLKGFNNAMDPHYHAEIDESDFLVGYDISKYMMMVGSLNWLVTLGRYDIHYTVTTLVRHMMMPRKGHMHAMKHFPLYGQVKEEMPYGVPNPKGKIPVDLVVQLRYNLRILGAEVK
eukprot:6648934-Ditylum_brightwellii.AAC.1